MTRAPRFQDGQWCRPRRRGFKFLCCDCGLTHRMDFRIVSERWGKGTRPRIEFRGYRDKRATANARRRQGLPMVPNS